MSATPEPRGRRSRGPANSVTSTPGDTTLTGLQRLPRYPYTPSRLAMSTTPSANRSVSRSRLTPRQRGVNAPSTPHGLRAMQRRAANTPGRDRRRSGPAKRETTFDILRNLGKALAPVSQPIRSSPQVALEPESEPELDEIEELDNEPEIERPRLSLPLAEEEEEDEDEGSPEPRPPRFSLAFEEEDITVEYPRRAPSEHDKARLSMASFGAPRLSEFGDATRFESDNEDEGDTGIMHDVDGQDETLMSQGAFDRGGETEDLGRFNFDFNFPSPPPPGDDLVQDEPMNDDEFELPAVDLEPGPTPASDDSDDAGDATGGFGLGLDLAAPVSPSQSSGVLGGGLRDESTLFQGTKQKKLSRHGIPVPNLPTGVVKKLATRFAPSRAGSKAKISKATLAAIEQASAWYFEQAGEDLAAYAKHAGRKTIDESDVTTLMRRQRHTSNATTVFSLAQKHLPKELLQDMRLAMPP
ncbi:hypothetical protein P168DRAFT_2390 [Aspergillus campestris IBT 28561]|uniref:CENP-T/Histone H4 histone fold domain-containing protein n=1 Tax=Aspergillus campestris (strain IBT 28561) TaxID=1392248 RepID=A0A2I1DD29_ASPC2|nr:uncharacterized protein P168DRAFT_2390 [Aspergillus campestris IBT 28561]PKY07786.1 hypothetical protein P168DRAFT_2390 [Aspergillus campestris IBT 28561]